MVGRRAPSPGLLRRIESAARMAMPATLAGLTMIVAAGPTGVPALTPAVALPQVVYWSITRPSSMRPAFAFLLGLLLDLLTLAPLGSGILTMLLAHGVAVAWRRVLARQTFLFVWLAFGGFAIGAAALGWLVTAVLSFSLPPPAPALHEAALTAGLYPMIALLLGRVEAVMRRAEEVA